MLNLRIVKRCRRQMMLSKDVYKPNCYLNSNVLDPRIDMIYWVTMYNGD